MIRRLPGPIAAVLCVAGLLVFAAPAQAGTVWGPFAPPNPYLGPPGSSMMHSDAGSSDATPLAGPGARPVSATVYPLAAACPTLLQGSDGLGRGPVHRDRRTGADRRAHRSADNRTAGHPGSPDPAGHAQRSCASVSGSAFGWNQVYRR